MVLIFSEFGGIKKMNYIKVARQFFLRLAYTIPKKWFVRSVLLLSMLASLTAQAVDRPTVLAAGHEGRKYCLTANYYGYGADVYMRTCNGSQQQQWNYDSNSKQIRDASGFWCLDLHRGHYDSNTNGGNIQVWQCYDNQINQQWTIDRERYRLQVHNKNLCLDVKRPIYMAKGQGVANSVQSWSCSYRLNQQWNFWTQGDYGIETTGIQYIDCSSINNETKRCYLPRKANGVWVDKQYSAAWCDDPSPFGVNRWAYFHNVVTVYNGCRARFAYVISDLVVQRKLQKWERRYIPVNIKKIIDAAPSVINYAERLKIVDAIEHAVRDFNDNSDLNLVINRDSDAALEEGSIVMKMGSDQNFTDAEGVGDEAVAFHRGHYPSSNPDDGPILKSEIVFRDSINWNEYANFRNLVLHEMMHGFGKYHKVNAEGSEEDAPCGGTVSMTKIAPFHLFMTCVRPQQLMPYDIHHLNKHYSHMNYVK